MRHQTFIKGLALVTMVLFLSQCREQASFYSNVLRSDVFYQLYQDSRYDFLWVFDNSQSMAPRRTYVRDNLQTFLNILNSRKAIDYQMAVVTTDYFTENGNLVKSGSGIEVVKSTDPDPVGDMASLINAVADSPTSFWEQGLESAYQAVFNHRAKFSRTGVPLVIVFLTDEEDWSCKEDCYGVEPENNTNWKAWPLDRYTNYFKQIKASENSEVIAFPIVGLDSSTCTVASLGARYEGLQVALGGVGVSGSICVDELQESYQNVARIVADRGMRFQLSYPASGQGISVFVDRQNVPYSEDDGYIFEASTNSIIFTGTAVPKNGAMVEVVYSQFSE